MEVKAGRAYMNFIDQFFKKHPEKSQEEMLEAWHKKRDQQVKKVQKIMEVLLKKLQE